MQALHSDLPTSLLWLLLQTTNQAKSKKQTEALSPAYPQSMLAKEHHLEHTLVNCQKTDAEAMLLWSYSNLVWLCFVNILSERTTIYTACLMVCACTLHPSLICSPTYWEHHSPSSSVISTVVSCGSVVIPIRLGATPCI